MKIAPTLNGYAILNIILPVAFIGASGLQCKQESYINQSAYKLKKLAQDVTWSGLKITEASDKAQKKYEAVSSQ